VDRVSRLVPPARLYRRGNRRGKEASSLASPGMQALIGLE
jgi:hypothetical protein